MLNINATTEMTTQGFILCTVASLIIGAVIALTFGYKSKKSKGFVMTLAVLPAIVQVVIMLVNGNVGTGVAVMGAFSLVRFRSVPGNAKDICGIFLAMAVGLATGTYHVILGAVFAAIVCLVVFIYTLLGAGFEKSREKELSITIPESLNYSEVFDDLLNKYTKSWELVQVKTTNLGSLFKLKYYITLKDDKSEKELIDELRCRNGNLEIMCAICSHNEIEQL